MGQGLLYGLVIGIAALVITTMIAFVIVSNVAVVDDSLAADVSVHVSSETSAYLNGTAYTVAKATEVGFVMSSITSIVNASGDTILSGNYTFSTAGVITNITADNVGKDYSDVTLNYYYTWTPTEAVADNMIANFSTGVENISNKIPTILLIAAVVLILSILALLWQQYQKMNVGGGSSL